MFDVIYRKYNLLRWVTLFWCCFHSVSSVASGTESEKQNEFVIAVTQPFSSRQSAMMGLIYHELFLRLGLPLRLVYLPLKRASLDANDGKIDGETGRIFQYDQVYTNMIRVEFPIVQVTISAFGRRTDQMKLADGWDSLTSTPYRVGYQRGLVVSESNLVKIIQPERLSAATNIRQGLLKVKHKRTDIFVHSYGIVMDNYLTQEEFHDIEVIGTMQKIQIYPYIHKKHKELAPVMADMLKEMEKQGFLYQYCKRVYAEQAYNHCIKEENGDTRLQW